MTTFALSRDRRPGDSSRGSAAPTRFLAVPGGQLAYDDTGGSGPLVVALSGLGDLRASYRFVVPRLAQAGCRVVTMDLRGMGDSSAVWTDYSVMALGDDVAALVRALDAGPALVVGNSYGAGAAAWTAARSPELVRGLVLLNPFVRNTKVGAAIRAALKVALAKPWGRLGWLALYGQEFVTKPADFAAYRKALSRNLREPGRMDSVRTMFWASKTPLEAVLGAVRAPTLVVMGSKDPDFPDPAREAKEVATLLRGEAHMLEGVGHYAHVEAPERVAQFVISLLWTHGGLEMQA